MSEKKKPASPATTDWRWDNEKTTYNHLYPLRESNGQVVCYAPEFPTKEHLALIAAAPELYEIVQGFLDQASYDTEFWTKARAVIAKVKGT